MSSPLRSRIPALLEAPVVQLLACVPLPQCRGLLISSPYGHAYTRGERQHEFRAALLLRNTSRRMHAEGVRSLVKTCASRQLPHGVFVVRFDHETDGNLDYFWRKPVAQKRAIRAVSTLQVG